ncbi:MAG: Membrane-flanked domain DUF304 [Microgenomates group bacterium GW2011_GWC1_37_12b]|nr:MAG: Membrane-flanked domain DUF304 [Microgenomates group bacterium GW2011_GWC1_37_12b]
MPELIHLRLKHKSPEMESQITEKNYPIEWLWVFKSSAPFLFIFSLLLISYMFDPEDPETKQSIMIYIGIIILFPTLTVLKKLTFHYSVESQFLTLRQGVLKKEERHIPYGVIQNVYVKQSIFDRIFKIASFTLENASLGAGAGQQPTKYGFLNKSFGKQKEIEFAGFHGNKVIIPGLKKENAESLKNILLQKIKENPIEDSQSGL